MTWYQAGVQYNDYKGTVAADRADTESLRKYLVAQGLAKDSENVVGFRIIFTENSGREIEKPGIVAYLIESDGFEPNPRQVRAVELDLSTSEFFKYLKRFDLVALNKSMNFENATVDGPYYD